MAITDRLFTQDMAIVALYYDAPSANTPPQIITNLISIFKDCKIRGETQKDPGRATSEGVDRSLPYAKKYTIDIGTVVDFTFPSLFRVYIQSGPGPYWIWLQFGYGNPAVIGWSFVTRAIIDTVNITAGGEEDTEGLTLEAIQEFQPIGSSNQIGNQQQLFGGIV